MDAPVYKKLLDIENQRENPFQTGMGQEVVSVQESFESRLFREGRPKNAMAQGTSANASTLTLTASVGASPGCEFYPTSVMISCDVDSQLLIKIDSKIQDVGSSGVIWEVVFAKAGTPLVRRFGGDVKVLEGGSVAVGVLSATAAKIYGSVYGIEVTTNA